MKRIICLMMAAVLCIGLLAGCGGKEGKPEVEEDTMESRLIGTWKRINDPDNGDSFELQFIFQTGGVAVTKVITGEESHDKALTWALDGDNQLTLEADGEKTTYTFSADAIEGVAGCWYMDGDAFYYQGMEFHKD